MKTTTAVKAKWWARLTVALVLLSHGARAEDYEGDPKWRGWIDMGGVLGARANLKEFAGPVTGQQLKLSPGAQLDLGLGYRLKPWLQIGPELGMIVNDVDAFGDFQYPNSSLFQMPILATVTVEYPYWGRFVPYAGAGVGGVASYLSFGNHWEWEPDGTGSDFVFGYEVFAGMRFRFSDRWSLGLLYRFTATEGQNWDVEWWTGQHFNVGVDAIQLHSFCLVFTGSF